MPVNLDKRERRVWRKVSRDLWERGMYDSLDIQVITQYCKWRAEADYLHSEVKRLGRVHNRNGKIMVSPFWDMWMKADGFANRLARQIGLTPAARMRKQPAQAVSERPAPRAVVLDLGEAEVVEPEPREGGGG